MNNIQKAGQSLRNLFYVLLSCLTISLGWIYFSENSSSSSVKDYINTYYLILVIALILILKFLFNASKYLINTDTLETTFENNEEILTTGERMRRMAEDSQ
jgi:TRAP-type C4-dicarboxylate transport system permease small subunit